MMNVFHTDGAERACAAQTVLHDSWFREETGSVDCAAWQIWRESGRIDCASQQLIQRSAGFSGGFRVFREGAAIKKEAPFTAKGAPNMELGKASAAQYETIALHLG